MAAISTVANSAMTPVRVSKNTITTMGTAANGTR